MTTATTTTVEEIVDKVTEWFHNSPEENRKEFLNCNRNDLYMYHNNLGRDIRNEFELWEVKWEPVMEDGVDWSPYHPDSISMRIIEEVWERLHESD